MTWKCPETSHSEENVCCVWIILSFSCKCGGQWSWWGCGRITLTTPSTIPISLLMAFVDLVLSSSYTSSSAGPAGYFSQLKKPKILYHIMILMFSRTTPQHWSIFLGIWVTEKQTFAISFHEFVKL